MSIEEVAKELKISERQVRKIELRALRKLRVAILKNPKILDLLGIEKKK